jgi:ketopantoate reductase
LPAANALQTKTMTTNDNDYRLATNTAAATTATTIAFTINMIVVTCSSGAVMASNNSRKKYMHLQCIQPPLLSGPNGIQDATINIAHPQKASRKVLLKFL